LKTDRLAPDLNDPIDAGALGGIAALPGLSNTVQPAAIRRRMHPDEFGLFSDSLATLSKSSQGGDFYLNGWQTTQNGRTHPLSDNQTTDLLFGLTAAGDPVRGLPPAKAKCP
jgi:hypothetical protein